MYKLLLSLSFCLLMSLSSIASHVGGGVINVSVDSNDVATIDLFMYRDGAGITFPASFSINLTDPGSVTQSVALSFITQDTISDTPFFMERYHYSGTIALTASGSYTAMIAAPCCRNAAVQNVPSSTPTVLTTTFTHSMGSSLNTPVFLTAPIAKFPKDSLWTYNPMPYDADGDSLYWSLGGNGYINNYTIPPSNPGGALSIDPNSGVISWNASQVGI
ncbi:MAG: hypothetical protein ACPF9D_12845, partial [Owenweeksia sp.]